MDKVCICLIPLLIAMNISMHSDIIKIEKQLKELKEIKMTVDNMESQIKFLTPPPEFFLLPEIKRQ